jgi:hypothetical protein
MIHARIPELMIYDVEALQRVSMINLSVYPILEGLL